MKNKRKKFDLRTATAKEYGLVADADGEYLKPFIRYVAEKEKISVAEAKNLIISTPSLMDTMFFLA